MFKSLQAIRIYVKSILPQERCLKAAEEHHAVKQLVKVLSAWRGWVVYQRRQKDKLRSAKFVMRRQGLIRALSKFKIGIARAQIQSLRYYQARQEYATRVKLNVMKGLARYSVAAKGFKQIKKA